MTLGMMHDMRSEEGTTERALDEYIIQVQVQDKER